MKGLFKEASVFLVWLSSLVVETGVESICSVCLQWKCALVYLE